MAGFIWWLPSESVPDDKQWDDCNIQDLRKKTARLVAAKCSLAARVDNFHESSDGAIGDQLRAEIEQKLEKLLEPPPVKQIKPLPAPIDPSRKKRGGRRYE